MDKLTFDDQWLAFTQASAKDGRFAPRSRDWHPILHEDTAHHGFEPHYTLFPGWAAPYVKHQWKHYDFGGPLTFATAMASVCVEFVHVDIRKLYLPFENIRTIQADLTALPMESESVQSASCLHVLEHVGLGRYGDALDAAGDRKAAAELQRVLEPGGQLLLVVPMDKNPRVCFNAHRFYGFDQILEMFPSLAPQEFSLITPDGRLHLNARYRDVEKWENCCGCFRFTK